jgi:hypothetical protein
LHEKEAVGSNASYGLEDRNLCGFLGQNTLQLGMDRNQNTGSSDSGTAVDQNRCISIVSAIFQHLYHQVRSAIEIFRNSMIYITQAARQQGSKAASMN